MITGAAGDGLCAPRGRSRPACSTPGPRCGQGADPAAPEPGRSLDPADWERFPRRRPPGAGPRHRPSATAPARDRSGGDARRLSAPRFAGAAAARSPRPGARCWTTSRRLIAPFVGRQHPSALLRLGARRRHAGRHGRRAAGRRRSTPTAAAATISARSSSARSRVGGRGVRLPAGQLRRLRHRRLAGQFPRPAGRSRRGPGPRCAPHRPGGGASSPPTPRSRPTPACARRWNSPASASDHLAPIETDAAGALRLDRPVASHRRRPRRRPDPVPGGRHRRRGQFRRLRRPGRPRRPLRRRGSVAARRRGVRGAGGFVAEPEAPDPRAWSGPIRWPSTSTNGPTSPTTPAFCWSATGGAPGHLRRAGRLSLARCRAGSRPARTGPATTVPTFRAVFGR